MPRHEPNDLLTPAQVVEHLRGVVGLRTLERWRTGGEKVGPPFLRIGNRPVYRWADLIVWENKHLYTTNSERVQDDS